jgi:hypothetical protein
MTTAQHEGWPGGVLRYSTERANTDLRSESKRQAKVSRLLPEPQATACCCRSLRKDGRKKNDT